MSFPFHPYQPFPRPLRPVPATNQGPFCLQFDAKWVPYLLGAVSILAVESTWATDIERSTGEARNLLQSFAAATRCQPIVNNGIEMDDCMGCCIRVENGHLQVFSCGEWQDVPGGDLTQIIQGTPEQPTDTGPLPAGGCREYNLTLNGNLTTLLPIPVNTGDTVEITTWSGAWHDGSGTAPFHPYYCADGGQYLIGACTGIYSNDPSDPIPTANHMSIIAEIGGIATYIAPMGSARTIPAGVTEEQLIFQANDSSISDNGGGVSFHVKVCRPTASPIDISYIVGSGPLAVSTGNSVIMTFVNEGPDNGLAFTLSREVKVKVTGSAGWNFDGTASANRFIGGVNVQSYDLSATLPEDASIEGCADKMTWGCAPGGTTQVQILFEEEC